MTETPTDEPELSAAKVIPLRLVPFEIENLGEKLCDHRGYAFVVDASERTCACKGCGRQVDPFLAIERIAAGWDQWRARRKEAIDGAVAAEHRLATLKAELVDVQRRLREQRRKVRPVFGVDKA